MRSVGQKTPRIKYRFLFSVREVAVEFLRINAQLPIFSPEWEISFFFLEFCKMNINIVKYSEKKYVCRGVKKSWKLRYPWNISFPLSHYFFFFLLIFKFDKSSLAAYCIFCQYRYNFENWCFENKMCSLISLTGWLVF